MRNSGDRSARVSGQPAWAFFCGIALACSLAPRDVAAYELRQTPSGAFERWESAHVAFVVDASLEAAAPGGVRAALDAISAWSGAGKAPDLSARVASGGGSEPAADGQNTVLYLPDGYPAAPGALAVTISTVDVGTGELLDTDIVINGRYAFAVLAQDALPPGGAQPIAMEGQITDTDGPCGPFDLQHVVAHEMGHALGLADVQNDLGAVMFAYTSAGDASRRAPSPDDVAGLDSLYAGANWRGGCSASRVGRERVEIDGVLFAWVSIGLVVVLVRRRRARGVSAGSRPPGTRVATRPRQERPEPTAIAPP